MHREAIIKNAQKQNNNFVNFYNGYSLKYEYNDKCKEQKQSLERRNIMSTLELLQLQNEHKDTFFEKGEENKVVSNKYVIHEDYDFEDGDGLKVHIEDGNIVFEATAEGGFCGFEWKCDIESFKKHIAKYEQGLT